jgi:hypothetical protein
MSLLTIYDTCYMFIGILHLHIWLMKLLGTRNMCPSNVDVMPLLFRIYCIRESSMSCL